MNKLRGSLWAKVLAITLLCLLALTCAGATLAAGWLYGEGAYEYGYETTARSLIGHLGHQYNNNVGYDYLTNGAEALYSDTNYRYTILSMDGELLAGTYRGQGALWEETTRVTAPHTIWTEMRAAEPAVTPTPAPQPTGVPVVIETPAPDEEFFVLIDEMTGQRYEFTDRAEVQQWEQEHSVQVRGYVLKSMLLSDAFSQRLSLFNRLYANRAAFPWIAGASLLLGVLLFVFLMSAAGHRDGTDTVTPGVVERLPYDLFTVAAGLALAGLVFLIGDNFALNAPSLALCLLAFLLSGLLFLLWCMSTATRLKLGTLWKSCLIYKLFALLFRALGKLPLVWKWALGVAALAFVDLIWRMASSYNEEALAAGWVLLWLLLGLVTCYAVLAFRRLRLGARRIVEGDESAAVDTKRLLGAFKAHAEDLNNIRAGLSRAVDERMKSERFRTELITNVSHDIKTPLTGIVSYVDLLGKEELDNDRAKEYVEVLQRQSARLKKLIDDLMEASKASTGNLPVTLTRCELGVLLEQAQGEYAERLEQAGLTLVAEKPDEPLTVMADGRHLWRIFDNLLGNICKYAQSGTRVYLTLAREGAQAVLTFRNISRDPIRLDGAELTERFVRGDSSRSTEGSGLGLAIAQSLAQLQGAELSVSVDGDLFKVILRFQTIA